MDFLTNFFSFYSFNTCKPCGSRGHYTIFTEINYHFDINVFKLYRRQFVVAPHASSFQPIPMPIHGHFVAPFRYNPGSLDSLRFSVESDPKDSLSHPPSPAYIWKLKGGYGLAPNRLIKFQKTYCPVSIPLA